MSYKGKVAASVVTLHQKMHNANAGPGKAADRGGTQIPKECQSPPPSYLGKVNLILHQPPNLTM